MKDDALLGFLVALVVAAILTPLFARLARRIGAVDAIKERGLARDATPLLGGLAIFAGVLVAALLFLPLTDATKGILGGAALITAVGALDDWRELGPATKLAGQVAAAMVLVLSGVSVDVVTLPFLGRVEFGTTGEVLTLLGLVGVMNVVNFSDGIDGLAAGTGMIALITFTAINIFTFIRLGQRDLPRDDFLDMAILGGALIGAVIGFLWYNAFPAEVIMGDTGSMAIGGALAAFAIMTNTELLLLLIGGIFLIEALSVILQVVSFKYWGRRIFLMAPIHHHFEMKAWSETKIMVRFWILSAILCAAAFAVYYEYFFGFRDLPTP